MGKLRQFEKAYDHSAEVKKMLQSSKAQETQLWFAREQLDGKIKQQMLELDLVQDTKDDTETPVDNFAEHDTEANDLAGPDAGVSRRAPSPEPSPRDQE